MFRIVLNCITTLVTCTLLEFSFFLMVTLVPRALSKFPFGLLRYHLAHFKNYLSLYYFVSFSCTFRIIFPWVVALVSWALLKFPFLDCYVSTLRKNKNSLSLDCYVSSSCTFRILFHWIATLVSCALLGFSFIGF